VAAPVAIKIARVPDSELSSWPCGTALGFVFEPVAQRFRVPVKLELPHDDPSGEVMCETSGGERHVERFDTKPGRKPFAQGIEAGAPMHQSARGLAPPRRREEGVQDDGGRVRHGR